MSSNEPGGPRRFQCGCGRSALAAAIAQDGADLSGETHAGRRAASARSGILRILTPSDGLQAGRSRCVALHFASPRACSRRFCRRLRGPSCGLRISAPGGMPLSSSGSKGRRYPVADGMDTHRVELITGGSAPAFGRGEAPACRGDRGPWARPSKGARRDGVVQRLLQTEPAQEDPLPGVGGEHAAPAPFRAMPRN